MAEAAPKQIADTIFGDLDTALKTARLAQRVRLTAAATGLQVCYYVGHETPPADAPPNLVHVPMERLAHYFETADTRVPTQVVLAGMKQATPADLKQWAVHVNTQIHQGLRARAETFTRRVISYREKARPPLRAGEKLRIFTHTSRETTVMQYSSRGLMRAFAQLGCDTRLVDEPSDMHRLDLRPVVESLESFDPHITININHLNNIYLPSSVVNAVWWQDIMPPLQSPTPLDWRPNDLVYTALTNGGMNDGIIGTGLSRERIQLQPFCIDTEIFHPGNGAPREDKIVFIGSSARGRLKGTANEARLETVIRGFVEEGRVLTEEEVFGLGALHGVAPQEAFHFVFYYVMRDELVRWLCRLPGIKVEVYGRNWGLDPEVAPFHKGELPHGPAVADIYRSAKYAYVLHPLAINTQRFAEAAACGCIPIAYDCRSLSDAPHWDDRVLFFKTPGELAEQIRRTVPTHAEEFRDFFSYERFARRILADAAPLLSREGT